MTTPDHEYQTANPFSMKDDRMKKKDEENSFKGRDSRFCACVSPVTSLLFLNPSVASRLPRELCVRG